MVGGALASWLAVTAATGADAHPEVLYGMLGPLAAACGTWVGTQRTYRFNPQRLTGVMVGGMAIKAVFFAVYVAVMLRGIGVRPRPFVLGFTGYFVALYGLEALFLKRLFRS
jgi:hypothetical protein